jgi:hypothetical protein
LIIGVEHFLQQYLKFIENLNLTMTYPSVEWLWKIPIMAVISKIPGTSPPVPLPGLSLNPMRA